MDPPADVDTDASAITTEALGPILEQLRKALGMQKKKEEGDNA